MFPRRSLLLALFALLTVLIAPVLAEGQATGKRTHKPLRLKSYYDQSVNLDGADIILGSLLEDEGIFLVLLPENPNDWDLDFIQQLARQDRNAPFPGIAKLALYHNTKYVKYAQDDLDHVGELMRVALMDDDTRRFLPEVGDEVLVVFFHGPQLEYRGAFRSVAGLRTEMETID